MSMRSVRNDVVFYWSNGSLDQIHIWQRDITGRARLVDLYCLLAKYVS